MTERSDTLRVAVDRREGAVVVLIDDAAETYEVTAKRLPSDCRKEGAVLDIPLSATGQPQWNEAVRNRAEEAKRTVEANERLQRLRGTDPGGDVQI